MTVVDVSVNLRGHVKVGSYKMYPKEAQRGVRPWTAPALIAEMDAAGVDMVGLIASVATEGLGGAVDAIHVDEVKAVMDGCKGRVFGWVGIQPLPTMNTLRYIEYGIRELGFKGVHLYPHWFGIPINDKKYYPIYAKCVEVGAAITIQIGSPTPRSRARLVATPAMLEEIAFDFPELTLIGLHIGWPYTQEMIMLCRNFENVFIMADAHRPIYWESVLLEYMQSRGRNSFDGNTKVMWGTDWPIQTFEESLGEVRNLNLDPVAHANLIGNNAVKILRLQ